VQDTQFDDYNGYVFQGESYNIFADCTLLEFVDMGQTQMESIYDSFFDGCTNLRNVILPATLRQIRFGAFSNTALESIELPESVSEISAGVFNKTRLRTLTIPENVKNIYYSAFCDNPRLVAINFPSTLESIGRNIFQNSLKLSAISCSAINAPEAATGAFDGIRAAQCSLTVPQQSFRSYLNAPQWGMFSELYNRLVVAIPESVEVTAVDEQEYQEILEEERLQAAVDAPVVEEDIEEDEDNNEEETPELRRRAVRRAASNSLADGSSFARLFDGAMIGTSSSSKGTRIFINLKDGATLKSVIYNGVDITSSLEGNSILLEGAGNGTLQINAIGGTTEIEEIETPENAADEVCEIYDMNGVLLYSGARASATLAPGIYVVRTANGTPEKVVIR